MILAISNVDSRFHIYGILFLFSKKENYAFLSPTPLIQPSQMQKMEKAP